MKRSGVLLLTGLAVLFNSSVPESGTQPGPSWEPSGFLVVLRTVWRTPGNHGLLLSTDKSPLLAGPHSPPSSSEAQDGGTVVVGGWLSRWSSDRSCFCCTILACSGVERGGGAGGAVMMTGVASLRIISLTTGFSCSEVKAEQNLVCVCKHLTNYFRVPTGRQR